ncbi:MAG: hypothetical protein FWE65_02430 [Eggerthellaceae bacterium]|nr:hypothetical protein [Eggerthellaceae bacterium]
MPGFNFSHRMPVSSQRPWHGAAFIVEALVLILFITLSTVVLMQLSNASRLHGEKAHALSYAVILATNEAERFAASPVSATTGYYDIVDNVLVALDEPTDNCFKVVRQVSREDKPSGVLFRAQIVVEKQGEILYTLNTARYDTREVIR